MESKDKSRRQSDDTIYQIIEENKALRAEVQIYRDAARLYGVDPNTMLALAKSKIKTCADNIRLMEKIREVFELFDEVPADLDDRELASAIVHYDGDNSKPYCDLVYCGLSILRKYVRKRGEYSEWRQGHLPEGF